MESPQKAKTVHFVRVGGSPSREVWSCRNNRTGREHGQVIWSQHWRQYAYQARRPFARGEGEIEEIMEFMRALTREDKKRRAG